MSRVMKFILYFQYIRYISKSEPIWPSHVHLISNLSLICDCNHRSSDSSGNRITRQMYIICLIENREMQKGHIDIHIQRDKVMFFLNYAVWDSLGRLLRRALESQWEGTTRWRQLDENLTNCWRFSPKNSLFSVSSVYTLSFPTFSCFTPAFP